MTADFGADDLLGIARCRLTAELEGRDIVPFRQEFNQMWLQVGTLQQEEFLRRWNAELAPARPDAVRVAQA